MDNPLDVLDGLGDMMAQAIEAARLQAEQLGATRELILATQDVAEQLRALCGLAETHAPALAAMAGPLGKLGKLGLLR